MRVKGLKYLLLVIFANVLNAQELEFVDLGIVEGEFKKIQNNLQWVNDQNREISLEVISKSNSLSMEVDHVAVADGETLDIPFVLELPQTPGYYEYEIQLVGAENVLIHGFQLGLQVLAAEIDVFKAYRNTQWPFRTKEQVFNLKAGFKGDTLSNTFDVYNLSGKDLDLGKVEVNDSIWLSFHPSTIEHNQFGQMTINLLASEAAPSGFQKIFIDLKSEEKVFSHLPVQFTLIPPKKYAENEVVSGGPQITSSIINHDFKVMEVGAVETVSITLANVGRESLVLERLQSNCDCLTYELPQKSIGPGKSVNLTVTFDATNRIGLERKTLAIFSNDPQNPTLVLTFRAHVK